MNHRILFPVALAAIYFVWGSAYLVTHVALQAFPPLLLSGMRNFLAGSILLVILRLRGVPLPVGAEYRGAAVVGALIAMSNGMIPIGMQSVATGVAAIMVATVPLFVSLIAAATGLRVRWPEWLGIALGLFGVGLLNWQNGMAAVNAGNAAILVGALCWALGTHLSTRVRLPANLMMATAMQIMFGGAIVGVFGWLTGARIEGAIGTGPWLAFSYLCVCASLLTTCAYMYLVRHASPAIAVSYAYVNPVVALMLGALLLRERITSQTLFALLIILASVGLVFWAHYYRRRAIA